MQPQSSTCDNAVNTDDKTSALVEETRSSNECKDVLYAIPKLEGMWTLLELVELDVQKDPRLAKVRRRDLPAEFWDERRRVRNRRRTLRRKESQRTKHVEVERTEEMRNLAVQAHLQQKTLVEAALCSGVRVAVDCSMSEGVQNAREVRSLVRQLQLCVGANKKAQAPLNLYFTGLAGTTREFAVSSMNAERWPAHLEAAPALHLFPRESLVLLSPDAESPLLSLDPSKVYVIGGLVDRSPLKNFTAEFARRHGIAAARLPIQEHLAPQAQRAERAEQGPRRDRGGGTSHTGPLRQQGGVPERGRSSCPQAQQAQQETQSQGTQHLQQGAWEQPCGDQRCISFSVKGKAMQERGGDAEDLPVPAALDGLPLDLQPRDGGAAASLGDQHTAVVAALCQPSSTAAARGQHPVDTASDPSARMAAELAARLSLQGGSCGRQPGSSTDVHVQNGSAEAGESSCTDVACRNAAHAHAPASADHLLPEHGRIPTSSNSAAQSPRLLASGCDGAASAAKKGGKKEGSFILNINDVVGILLAVNAGASWQEAFKQCIPQRKQQQQLGGSMHAAD